MHAYLYVHIRIPVHIHIRISVHIRICIHIHRHIHINICAWRSRYSEYLLLHPPSTMEKPILSPALAPSAILKLFWYHHNDRNIQKEILFFFPPNTYRVPQSIAVLNGLQDGKDASGPHRAGLSPQMSPVIIGTFAGNDV